MKRWQHAVIWVFSIALFVWLYQQAARSWFLQDDFAWLGQGRSIHSLSDWFTAVFAPRAQGTIRPWSERLFFMILWDRFGLDHRPFHLWISLTQLLNLALLQMITVRMTRSAWATLVAAVVWLCGIGLATPMAWISSYNQVLCATFLLAAFWLLLRYLETGKARWWWAQVAVFVLGFGALEVQIMYPVVAIAWCALAARPHLRRTLWLLPISAAYGVLHMVVARNPASGVYAQHWDASIAATLVEYVRLALTGGIFRLPGTWPHWNQAVVAAVLAGLALAAIGWCWQRGNRVPAFGLIWFVALLAPILPLRDHVMDYYLALPGIGLAWIAAGSVAESVRAGWKAAPVTVAALALYFLYVIPANRSIVNWRHGCAARVRSLVLGVERAHELHPDKKILLVGVNSDLFWMGLRDKPYLLFGVTDICLPPESHDQIGDHGEPAAVGEAICTAADIGRSAAAKKLVVYATDGPVLRNVTSHYVAGIPESWKHARRSALDIGSVSANDDLGTGWYPPEAGARWMGRRAEFWLGGTGQPAHELALSGYSPMGFLKQPLRLSVRVNGLELGERYVQPDSPEFKFVFPLPKLLAGTAELHVELAVDSTHRIASDSRELGLAFGQTQLR